MALFKLNVYGTNDEVIKTYETSKIKYGLIEDFISFSDEIKEKSVFEQFTLMKPIIKNLFVGITDEELKNIDIVEFTKVLYEMIGVAKNGYGGSEGKN